MFENVKKRQDDTYVIDKNGLPYHVISDDPLFSEVQRFEVDNPAAVTLIAPEPAQTADEILAAKIADIESKYQTKISVCDQRILTIFKDGGTSQTEKLAEVQTEYATLLNKKDTEMLALMEANV